MESIVFGVFASGVEQPWNNQAIDDSIELNLEDREKSSKQEGNERYFVQFGLIMCVLEIPFSCLIIAEVILKLLYFYFRAIGEEKPMLSNEARKDEPEKI